MTNELIEAVGKPEAKPASKRSLNEMPHDLPALIVFADDWGRHPSSCQHLVQLMSPRWKILWVNTIGTRKVKMNSFTFRRGLEKLRNWSDGLQTVSDNMWTLDVPMLPTSNSRWSTLINRHIVTRRIKSTMRRLRMSKPVVLTTLPYIIWLLGDIDSRALVYYCTDDYSYWPSADREALQSAERQISLKADLILAASKRLEFLHSKSPRCRYFPHAVDYQHFSNAACSTADIPPQLNAIPGPRVGFFGLIYEKLDFELLTQIARSYPDVHLVMIGPVDYCPDSFASLPNVHLVGKQSYEELPNWIAGIDILLMPYVHDEMIWQSNPLKLRECLATGKPTISVDIPEVRQWVPCVRIAKNAQDFVDILGELLEGSENPQNALDRRSSVAGETWECRAAELEEHIQSLPGSN